MKFCLNFRGDSAACLKGLLSIQYALTIWSYLVCSVGLSSISLAEARIFSERRRDAAPVEVRPDVAPGKMRLPSSIASSDASDEVSRRRSRRSSDEVDWREFRQFLHRFRKSGARFDVNNEQMVRRHSASHTMDKRLSTGNMIASNVKCGACKLMKQWIPIKKPGCRTNFIYAPTCMGMCETWEIPDINPPYFITNHKVCRPTTIEYRKIRLRRCSPGVNNFYMMPIAKNCECTVCNSKNTACRPFL